MILADLLRERKALVRKEAQMRDLLDLWRSFRSRCTNPNDHCYATHGGVGIKIHQPWIGKRGFALFMKDVGVRPSQAHHLKRVNSNGDYTPENLAWTTNKRPGNMSGWLWYTNGQENRRIPSDNIPAGWRRGRR